MFQFHLEAIGLFWFCGVHGVWEYVGILHEGFPWPGLEAKQTPRVMPWQRPWQQVVLIYVPFLQFTSFPFPLVLFVSAKLCPTQCGTVPSHTHSPPSAALHIYCLFCYAVPFPVLNCTLWRRVKNLIAWFCHPPPPASSPLPGIYGSLLVSRHPRCSKYHVGGGGSTTSTPSPPKPKAKVHKKQAMYEKLISALIPSKTKMICGLRSSM